VRGSPSKLRPAKRTLNAPSGGTGLPGGLYGLKRTLNTRGLHVDVPGGDCARVPYDGAAGETNPECDEWWYGASQRRQNEN
jgi:hypothetical protein